MTSNSWLGAAFHRTADCARGRRARSYHRRWRTWLGYNHLSACELRRGL